MLAVSRRFDDGDFRSGLASQARVGVGRVRRGGGGGAVASALAGGGRLSAVRPGSADDGSLGFRAGELGDAPARAEGARCLLPLPSGALLSGGSDACVRMWCPGEPARSRVVSASRARFEAEVRRGDVAGGDAAGFARARGRAWRAGPGGRLGRRRRAGGGGGGAARLPQGRRALHDRGGDGDAEDVGDGREGHRGEGVEVREGGDDRAFDMSKQGM